MEQAFLLTQPETQEEGLDERVDLSFWQLVLDRLAEGKWNWERLLSALKGPLHSHAIVRLVTSRFGRSLLHLAICDERRDLIPTLLESPRLKLQRDAFGLTPFDLAKFLHKEECINLLCPKSPFSLQSNVFIDPPDLDKFLGIDYLPQPVFETRKGFDDILIRTKKAKHEDLVPPERIWMGIYFDREIERGFHPPVAIRYIDSEVGFGVFAKQRIPPCAFAGEYTGVIQERKKRNLKDKIYCVRYTVWEMGKRNFIIDAEKGGNFTRFINHSAAPNLCLQSVYWRGIPRMVFVSLKEIPAGAQLTFDYGNIFWKGLAQTPKLFP